MKKFKFLQHRNETYIRQEDVRRNRRYLGLTRGSISWVEYPIVQVHYMEPTASYDPINEDDVPLLNLELRYDRLILEQRWINSINELLSECWDHYILILNFTDVNGNIYTQNGPSIPTNIRLMYRGLTFL